MKAWWVVLVGLALAVAAGLALLSSGPTRAPAGRDAPLGEIRDDSREAMRDLLRDAEEERR